MERDQAIKRLSRLTPKNNAGVTDLIKRLGVRWSDRQLETLAEEIEAARANQAAQQAHSEKEQA